MRPETKGQRSRLDSDFLIFWFGPEFYRILPRFPARPGFRIFPVPIFPDFPARPGFHPGRGIPILFVDPDFLWTWIYSYYPDLFTFFRKTMFVKISTSVGFPWILVSTSRRALSPWNASFQRASISDGM
jgi:hypothetical protein